MSDRYEGLGVNAAADSQRLMPEVTANIWLMTKRALRAAKAKEQKPQEGKAGIRWSRQQLRQTRPRKNAAKKKKQEQNPALDNMRFHTGRVMLNPMRSMAAFDDARRARISWWAATIKDDLTASIRICLPARPLTPQQDH